MDGSQQPRGVMPARPPIGRDHGGIQALDRAFLILDIIADAGGEAKLTEIAGAAGLHVSTCHHLISTLCNWGYVARGTLNRSYVLGPRILHLSAACLRQVDLPRRAHAYIDRLNDQTHEACSWRSCRTPASSTSFVVRRGTPCVSMRDLRAE